jgi:hypothetical protein
MKLTYQFLNPLLINLEVVMNYIKNIFVSMIVIVLCCDTFVMAEDV